MGGSRLREYRHRHLPRCVRVFVSRSSAVLLWSTRGGVTYSGRYLSFLSDDGDDQRSEVWSSVWEGPMKRKDKGECPGLAVHASPKGLVDTHASMAEFLTAAVFEEDQSRREAPTITVWAAGGQWKASVKDRAEGLVMWLSADTWAELCAMVDLMCLEPSGPWRHDDQAHERNGKRVKK